MGAIASSMSNSRPPTEQRAPVQEIPQDPYYTAEELVASKTLDLGDPIEFEDKVLQVGTSLLIKTEKC